jgi:hypothetical protein
MVTSKDDLYKMFPLQCTTVPTDGIQVGVILKFKTFYLKIYDDKKSDSYIIQGFRYHEHNPVFVDKIPSYKILDFAKQFTREDYLLGFQEPCDDPNCVLRGRSTRTSR